MDSDESHIIIQIRTGVFFQKPMAALTKHKRPLSPAPHVGDLPIIQLAGPATLLNYLDSDQLTVFIELPLKSQHVIS
jgi:Cu/Zn superoxide dismutase